MPYGITNLCLNCSPCTEALSQEVRFFFGGGGGRGAAVDGLP